MPAAVRDSLLVGTLFAGYTLLWRVAARRLRRETGRDPEVIHRDPRPSQAYFSAMSRVLTVSLGLLLALHALPGVPGPGFARFGSLDGRPWDAAGFVLGIGGLLLCRRAQRDMALAWRVGIDTRHPGGLVTRGLFAAIRNPTYTGLLTVCLGAWLIMPTMALLTWIAVFWVMLEFQTRLEEEHLTGLFGDEYLGYLRRTRRFIPWVY
jgi:protein-S-isoprenylcysteine O-methyltransferase Ste14